MMLSEPFQGQICVTPEATFLNPILPLPAIFPEKKTTDFIYIYIHNVIEKMFLGLKHGKTSVLQKQAI